MTTLTTDGVLAVAETLGVQTLPTVLALRPRHADQHAFAAARAAVLPELGERGVLDRDGIVVDDLATALFVLARPDRQLALRIRRGDTLQRVCLARRGLDHALAVRTDDDLEVRQVWGEEDATALARPLLGVLGPCPPAEIPVFSALTTELQQRLDDAGTTHASAAYQLGMPEPGAIALGLALRHCDSLAELVCYTHRDGQSVRSPASAAVYDTADGRIIGGGSVAADGQLWTTLAPGSDHRLAQVLAAQIEALPEGRWMP